MAALGFTIHHKFAIGRKGGLDVFSWLSGKLFRFATFSADHLYCALVLVIPSCEDNIFAITRPLGIEFFDIVI